MNYGDRIATEIVESMIEALTIGVNGKWSAPWTNLGSDMPKNAFSGREYNGFNPLYLSFVAQRMGYTSPHWATFPQWKKAGHKVIKDTKTTPIAFWQPTKYTETLKDGSEKDRTGFMFKVYRLINSDCVEGWEPPTVELNEFMPIERCQSTVEALQADIRHGGNRAFFSPSVDIIQMPEPEQFDSSENYYATLFHEITHWTGHKDRLDREFGTRFGNDAYAFEELVAELGAAMLCARHGIETQNRDSHAQYIQHWIKVLRANPKALWTAGSKAQAANNYVMQAGELSKEDEKLAA